MGKAKLLASCEMSFNNLLNQSQADRQVLNDMSDRESSSFKSSVASGASMEEAAAATCDKNDVVLEHLETGAALFNQEGCRAKKFKFVWSNTSFNFLFDCNERINSLNLKMFLKHGSTNHKSF